MDTATMKTDKTARLFGETAVLEGGIPLPPEAMDIAGVINITGTVEVTDVSIADEKATVRGTAYFTIVYAQKNGDLDSFDAECAFEHTADIPQAEVGMDIMAQAYVSMTQWRMDGNLINLSAVIAIDFYACCPKEYAILRSDDNADIEYELGEAVCEQSSLHTAKAYLNEKIRVPQNMPQISKILSVSGYPTLYSIRKEPGRIVAEGDLRLFVNYVSADKNAPLQSFSETIPFSELIADDNCAEDSLVFLSSSLEKISAELTEEDILSLSAVISIASCCTNQTAQPYVKDMYSLSRETFSARRHIPICSYRLVDPAKKVIRINTTIPDSMPEAARVLFTTIVPEITSAVCDGEHLGIDGILHITLCYTTQESGIKSVTIKEPFDSELILRCTCSAPEVRAFAEYATATGSGREIEIKTCLEFIIVIPECNDIAPLTSVEFSDDPIEQKTGITICYADGKQTLWDICRKYYSRRDGAICLDSEEETPAENSRIVLIR